MRYFLYSLILISLFSCSSKIIPIKGNYPATPMVFHSDNTFEQTWDKLVDLFAQKGLTIKIIDKSSGLIISSNSLMPATPEDSKGNPKDPSAYIVVPSVKANGMIKPVTGSNEGAYTSKKAKIYYEPVYGEWNVRVKPDGKGSSINVNITNVTYKPITISKYSQPYLILRDYKSTGVFERDLANIIK